MNSLIKGYQQLLKHVKCFFPIARCALQNMNKITYNQIRNDCLRQFHGNRTRDRFYFKLYLLATYIKTN